MTLNVLGTPYSVEYKKWDDDPLFQKENWSGYCDGYGKRIVVCDPATVPGFETDPTRSKTQMRKQTLRHEIVHAFLNESGLMDCALVYEGPWSKCEELVDWIANQGQKIYRAWKKAGAL